MYAYAEGNQKHFAFHLAHDYVRTQNLQYGKDIIGTPMFQTEKQNMEESDLRHEF